MLLVAVSCGSSHHTRPDRTIRAQFRTIQPLLLKSEKVDSCLTVLQAMDTAALKRPADRARWSLLYAMALDKNYIDTTDLSVLAPAMECYTPWHHLNRKDKFYTWYYKARIEENARVYDASLNSYLHAERYMGATDDVYRTRLYFGFERVYNGTISHFKAYESAKQALYYAKKTDRVTNISNALCDCACDAAVFGEYQDAKYYLAEYDTCMQGVLGAYESPVYLRAKMIYYQYQYADYPDSAGFYLNKYLFYSGTGSIDYPSCLLTCIKTGDMHIARQLLSEYEEVCSRNNDSPSLLYYCRYLLGEAEGDDQHAFKDLKEEMSLINKKYTYNLDKEIQSLELKYKSELLRVRIRLVSVISLLVLLLLSLLIILRNKKRAYKYQLISREYEGVKREYESINALFSAENDNERGASMDMVQKRILEMGRRLGNGKSPAYAARTLSRISGPKEFLISVSYLAATYNRSVFSSLQDKGLNVQEIGICVLILMGVRVSELEDILNRKSIYNITRDIRSKIGAKGDGMNIRQYLEKLIAQKQTD